MIVVRWSQVVKRGHQHEAVELWKDWATSHPDQTLRVYSDFMASHHTIAIEVEYDTLAEYEKSRAEWVTPEFRTFAGKLNPLLADSGCTEAWHLEHSQCQ